MAEQGAAVRVCELIRELFLGSCRVVGVGFGLEGDLGMLAHYPDLTDICAEALAKRLYLDFKHTVDCRSLSDLCQRTLLAKLNKTMQTSDWSRRPLSEDQLTYAALDAKVLLLIRQQLVDTGAAPAWQQSQQSQQSSSPLQPLAGLAGVVAGASRLGLPVRLVPAVESAAAEFEVPSGAEVLPASIGRGQIVAKSLALVVEPDHSSCPCAGEGHGHDACLSPEPGLVMCVLALERTRLCFASVRAVLAEHGLTGAGGPLGAGCVRMASKTELVRYTGLVAGTVGPVLPGESRRRPVLLVDEALVDAAKGGLLLLGSGERRCHLALTAEEIGGEALGGRVGALSVSCS